MGGMGTAGFVALVFGCISVVLVDGAVSGIAGNWGCVDLIQ
jgi:hypothetical protein